MTFVFRVVFGREADGEGALLFAFGVVVASTCGARASVMRSELMKKSLDIMSFRGVGFSMGPCRASPVPRYKCLKPGRLSLVLAVLLEKTTRPGAGPWQGVWGWP